MADPGFGDWYAASIDVNSEAAGFDVVDFTAHVDDLQRAGVNYGTLTAAANGALSALETRVDWARGDLDGHLTATVRQEENGITGTVIATSIDEPDTGLWNLVEPFAFRFAAGSLEIDRHEWSNRGSKLRVSNFTITDGSTRVVADLSSFPLALANPWLPPNMQLLGSADASVDLVQTAGRWNGSIAWRQSDTILRVAQVNDQLTDVIIPRAELDATLQDDAIEVQAQLSIEPEVSAELDLRLAALSPDAALRAELRVQGDRWDWVSAVIPEIDNIEGSIHALVRAEGPLSAPEFDGDVSWREGRLRVPALNVPLHDIDVVVSGGSAGTATLTGTATAGDGTLSVTGQFDRLMQEERSLRLHLTGKSAQLIGWPEYRLWATPDLIVVGDRRGWRFDGSVEVPRADIEVRELPVEAVPVSPDVVILGAEEPVRPTSRIVGDGDLTIGNRVHVKALGLDSGLSGSLSIRVAENATPSAEGVVSLVDGVFAGYGQKLTIREGKLTFTGPLDDPIVDVTAVRVIDTLDGQVTAGIRLRGRAQNLSSTVFAEPAMAEADALSYLVIGRPLNQATAAEGGDLTGAALALGIKQAGRLTEQIARTLGLDQLSLTGDGGETTALVAGKQVNSRLYARYAFGVFSRLGVLFLRYRLSARLSLEASTGENQSIDVLYSVEKN